MGFDGPPSGCFDPEVNLTYAGRFTFAGGVGWFSEGDIDAAG